MGKASRAMRAGERRVRVKFMIPTPGNPAALLGNQVGGEKFGIDGPIGKIVAYQPVEMDSRRMVVTAELFERTRAVVMERMSAAGARLA